MKKLLCIILCGILLLLTTSAFAEEGGTMTRVEALRMIAENTGFSEKEYECPFTDIAKEDKNVVGYIFEKGWIKGTGDNLFSPDSTMTRECFLTIVLRSLKYTDPLSFEWNNPYNRAFIAGIYPVRSEGGFTLQEAEAILRARKGAYSLYTGNKPVGGDYTKNLSYVSSRMGKVDYLLDLDNCTVVIGYITGTSHGSAPRGSIVFKESGECIDLELPRVSPWKNAPAENVSVSEDNAYLYYTCTVESDYIGMDGVTLVQEAGVFEYCIDLNTKETSVKKVEKN